MVRTSEQGLRSASRCYGRIIRRRLEAPALLSEGKQGGRSPYIDENRSPATDPAGGLTAA